MTGIGLLEIAVFFGVIMLVTKPFGSFLASLYEGRRTFLHPVLRPLEVLIYKLCGVREDAEQRWTQYAGGILSFSIFAFLFTYAIQRAQAYLPFNPQNFGTPVMTP